jgi:hypothetical protein
MYILIQGPKQPGVDMIGKLHSRYKFPKPFDNKKLKGNKVNKLALTRMSTALSS